MIGVDGDWTAGFWGAVGVRAVLTRDQAVALVEVVHREVDSPKLAPGDGQVARHARAGGEHHRVEAGAQLLHGDVAADLHAAAQLHALLNELTYTALDDPLLDLEVGHPKAHQAPGGLVALEQRDAVPGATQLLGGGHPRGPGADDGDRLAGFAAG